jgi:hypothetical protein
MNTDLVDSMNIDQSLIFTHDENEIILEVDEEDAQQLLSETETPTTTTSQGTTPSPINIANALTTINAKDFGSANFPHLIMIKAAYAVRNVAFQNETDSIQVATTTCQTRTNFHTRDSWWAEQLKQAKKMIQQTTPYSWAKSANVLELSNPHLYYFITGAHNCQVLKKIELPLTPEKLSLLPTPANGPDGNFRIRISFTVNFGRQEHQHKADAWKLMEPHIQHIYPAARIMAESYMELPDLNCTRSDVRTYIHQARRRFEENCKNTFFLLPLTKLHPFRATSTSNTPPTSSADSSKDSFTQISPVPNKTTKSIKSTSDSTDDENESDKSVIVFSYKEKQEILEEAVRMANISEKQKALMKIITATGSQSPIQDRITVNEPSDKSEDIILIEKPLKTNIKPLATPRERRIERDYSPKYADKHRRRNDSKSPSRSSYPNHRSRYERTDQYYHQRNHYHSRSYEQKPYKYRQNQHPYEQPHRRSAHLRLEPRVHHYSQQSSRESSRAPTNEDNDDINMDQTFNVNQAVAPSPSDNVTTHTPIDDDNENLPIYRDITNLEKFVKYKTADGQTIFVQKSTRSRSKKSQDRKEKPIDKE